MTGLLKGKMPLLVMRTLLLRLSGGAGDVPVVTELREIGGGDSL
jgi:hypothetical protein